MLVSSGYPVELVYEMADVIREGLCVIATERKTGWKFNLDKMTFDKPQTK